MFGLFIKADHVTSLEKEKNRISMWHHGVLVSTAGHLASWSSGYEILYWALICLVNFQKYVNVNIDPRILFCFNVVPSSDETSFLPPSM